MEEVMRLDIKWSEEEPSTLIILIFAIVFMAKGLSRQENEMWQSYQSRRSPFFLEAA